MIATFLKTMFSGAVNYVPYIPEGSRRGMAAYVFWGCMNRNKEQAIKCAEKKLERLDAQARAELKAKGWEPQPLPPTTSEKSLYAEIPETEFVSIEAQGTET